MKSQYEGYSREELIEILEGYANGSKAEIYAAGVEQLSKMAVAFRKAKIDITSDSDKTFVNFQSFMKNSRIIQENLDALQKTIDPSIIAKMKRDEQKAGTYSVEDVAANKDV